MSKTYKLALGAGHYKGTPGRRCLKEYDSDETQEWELNDRIADRVQLLLCGYSGIEVLRLDDTDGERETDLKPRTDMANLWNADFYLSIHHNAGINGGNGGGLTVHVFPQCSAESRDWAERLYAALIEEQPELKGNRSDPIVESNLHVLRETKMSAALIEAGFMDSPTDIPNIITDDHADKCASAIVRVLVDKWGLIKRDEESAEPVADTETLRKLSSMIGDAQIALAKSQAAIAAALGEDVA